MSEREERFKEALQRLLHWSEVYSRDVFPEPDWEKAGELPKAVAPLPPTMAHCWRPLPAQAIELDVFGADQRSEIFSRQ